MATRRIAETVLDAARGAARPAAEVVADVEASTAHRVAQERAAAVDDLLSNHPPPGRRVGRSIESSREVLERADGLPRQGVEGASIRTGMARDAQSRAPLESEFSAGVEGVIETIDRPATTIGPREVRRGSDFEAVANDVHELTAGVAADDDVARVTLGSMLDAVGVSKEGQSAVHMLRPEVARNAARHLATMHALGQDLVRAAHRAVAADDDVGRFGVYAAKLNRVQAYARWMVGDDARADLLLRGAPRARGISDRAGRIEHEYYALRMGAGNLLEAADQSLTTSKLGEMLRLSMQKGRPLEDILRARAGPTGGLMRSAVRTSLILRATGFLSGPSTHLINIASGVMNALIRIPEAFVAGAMRESADGSGALTRGLRESGAYIAGALQGLMQMGSVMARSARAAGYGTREGRLRQLQDAQRADSLSRRVQSFAVAGEKADLDPNMMAARLRFGAIAEEGRPGIPMGMLQWADQSGEAVGTIARAVDRSLGLAIQSPFAALQIGDAIVKNIVYNGELRRRAMLEASEQLGAGASAAQRKSLMRQIMNGDPDDATGAAGRAHEAALVDAKRATFTEALHPTSQAALDFLNTQGHGVLRTFVPFYHALSNMASQSLQRSWVATAIGRRIGTRWGLSQRSLDTLDRISATAEGRADWRARQVVATSLMGGTATLGFLGVITPDRHLIRSQLRGEGQSEPPMSLRVGDGWVSLDKALAGPLLPIRWGVNMGALLRSQNPLVDGDDGGLMNDLLKMSLINVTSVFSQSPLSMVHETLEEIVRFSDMIVDVADDDGGKHKDFVVRQLTRYLETLMPGNVGAKQLSEAMQGGARRSLRGEKIDSDATALEMAGAVWDEMLVKAKARYMWTSDEQPVVRDVFGDPMTHGRPVDEAGGISFGPLLGPLSYRPKKDGKAYRALLATEYDAKWTPPARGQVVAGHLCHYVAHE